MAQKFRERIEALTSFTISNSSVPEQDDVTTFILDGVKCTVNGIIGVNPAEAQKFSIQSIDSNNSGVTLTGAILDVVRRDGDTATVRPCELIDAKHRYLATDVDSLHYRSANNPGYYLNGGLIYIVPSPSDSNSAGVVSQVGYANTESAPLDGSELDHNSTGIANFPDEYEHLVALYAAAMVCMAKAGDVHNSLDSLKIPDLAYAFEDIEEINFSTPTLGTFFVLPNFTTPALVTPSFSTTTSFTLPTFDSAPKMNFAPAIADMSISVPTFVMPEFPNITLPGLDFNLNLVRAKLDLEDIELADKELEIVSKEIERFDKNLEVTKEQYQDAMDDFEKQFEEAKLEYETEFAKNKEQFDKDFQIALQEFDKKFNKAKAEFDQEWEEQKIVYQNDFARQQAEFEQEWDEDKVEYQSEFQKRIKEFDSIFQRETFEYTKEFERQAIQYKQKVDQEVLEYQSKMQTAFKNADNKMALEIQRNQSDIAVFQADIGKLTQKYQWWVGQYQALIGQFVNNIQMKKMPQPAQPQQENRRR